MKGKTKRILVVVDDANGVIYYNQNSFRLSIIDTQGFNGLSTGDDRQSRLMKFMQASYLLWERAVMPD